MRAASSFVGGLLILAFVFLRSGASGQQFNPRERVIDDKYSYESCPIKIVGVETSKHKVTLGKSFSDDDDWLNGLAVRVENTSGKVVTHVGIKLVIERPADERDQPRASWDLWYGVSPFSVKLGEPIPPSQVRPIQPGETETIVLSDTEYDSLRSFLKDVKFPASIEMIHISVYTIGFADGTAWGGQLYRRDPGARGGWTPADEPRGRARKRPDNQQNQKRVTELPLVISHVPKLEIVSATVRDPGTPAATALVEIRNNSDLAVMTVEISTKSPKDGGDRSAFYIDGLEDPENVGVIIPPKGTKTLEMALTNMIPDAPLVVSAAFFADGTEEGDKWSLDDIRATRAHRQELLKTRRGEPKR
jgi:hypothetical protein